MTVVFMLSRRLWSFRLAGQDHEFFESCGAAIRSLIDRGHTRREITIDYESETAATRAKITAKRFVAAYGAGGKRFMVDGVLPDWDECPALAGGIEEQRALRKIPRVCPHCGKPIRPRDWDK